MEIETVGENAGKVWRNLNENRGEISIQELSRKMNLSAIDVAIAIGWLCRENNICLLYTSPSPRDYAASRMPSSA